MLAGLFHGAIELLRQRAIQNVVDQRGFAGAGDAGDDGEQAERKRDVDILQIVVRARPGCVIALPLVAAALLRHGNSRARRKDIGR